MSQSKVHRRIVFNTALALKQRHPQISLCIDLQEFPGDPVPPIIGGYRPDILAYFPPSYSDILIAEAKTSSDIDRQHTFSQIDAFLNYLGEVSRGIGTFVLAVDGYVADHARMVLALTYRMRISSRLYISLFDGLDFWMLNPFGSPQWRLS